MNFQAPAFLLSGASMGVSLCLAAVSVDAQESPSVAIEQIPSERSVEVNQAAPRSSASPLVDPEPATRAVTPAQISQRGVPTAVPPIPSQAIDICDSARVRREGLPKGVDCTSRAQPRAQRPLPQSAEELLLGIAPRAVLRTTTVRSVGVPDADEVARRLGTGDVQDAPIAEAVGAGIRNTPTPPATPPVDPNFSNIAGSR